MAGNCDLTCDNCNCTCEQAGVQCTCSNCNNCKPDDNHGTK